MSRRKIPPDHVFTIESLNPEGFGAATYQANEQAKPRQVLIKGSLPNEQVTAHILKRKASSFFAEMSSLARPSSTRVPAPCGHFPRCGGCTLQHASYPQQLQHKQDQLMGQLDRVAVPVGNLVPPVFGAKLHYRSKARLGVRLLGDETLLGFRESFSSRVLRMEQCLVLQPRLHALVPALRRCIEQLSIASLVPQVELAAGDTPGAHQTQVVLRHLAPLLSKDLALLQKFAWRNDATVLLQPGGPQTLISLETAQASQATDSTHPVERLPLLGYGLPQFGLQLQFGALDFTQVNLALNQRLVRQVIAALAPAPGQVVLDLFCGIGNFALALARAGARVVGFEGSVSSIHRARSNAEHNGLSGTASFAALDLYGPDAGNLFMAPSSSATGNTAAGELAGVSAPVSAMVIDPPRSGAGPHLGSWLNSALLQNLQQIAYVSCNPVSFADDALVLQAAGFRLTNVGIFDMFPQTSHVETLGLFKRG